MALNAVLTVVTCSYCVIKIFDTLDIILQTVFLWDLAAYWQPDSFQSSILDPVLDREN